MDGEHDLPQFSAHAMNVKASTVGETQRPGEQQTRRPQLNVTLETYIWILLTRRHIDICTGP